MASPRPNPRQLRVDYTNWRGERRTRVIEPVGLIWGITRYHTEEQYLLMAKDCEDEDRLKSFAFTGFHGFMKL